MKWAKRTPSDKRVLNVKVKSIKTTCTCYAFQIHIDRYLTLMNRSLYAVNVDKYCASTHADSLTADINFQNVTHASFLFATQHPSGIFKERKKSLSWRWKSENIS